MKNFLADFVKKSPVLALMSLIIQLSGASWACCAQNTLSLDYCTNVLALESPQASMKRNEYANALLEFENFKKSLLPAISLTTNPFTFNRSMKLIQQASDGVYHNIDDYTFSSDIGLSVQQQVGFTGGTISVSSSLSYLNELKVKTHSFSTNPISISYSQPLWGGGRSFKYSKELQYKRNNAAIREYCSSIADVQLQTAKLYLQALSAQVTEKFAQDIHDVADSLILVGKTQLSNGDITEFDYRQIVINKSNSEMSLKDAQIRHSAALRDLCDYLGIEYNTTIILEEPLLSDMPDILTGNEIMRYSKMYGTFEINQDISFIDAEQALFNAKKNSFLGGSISLTYGTNQYANSFYAAYKNPNEREYAAISLEIPIFQWGLTKNKRVIASNEYKNKITQIHQNASQYASSIETLADEYNSNYYHLSISRETLDLSREQYHIFLEKTKAGRTNFSDYYSLLQAQSQSATNYINAVSGFWGSYFNIQKITLYNFIQRMPLIDILIH